MRSLWLSGLVVLAALLVPSAAQACSCVALGNPEKQARFILKNSDGAFIGELLSKKPKSRGGKGYGPKALVFTYRVEEAFGQRLGDRIKIGTTNQTAACGLSGQIGKRYALGFTGRQGDWSATLCSFMNPRALKDVAGEDKLNRAASGVGCAG